MSVDRHERQINDSNDDASGKFKADGGYSNDQMYSEINSIRKEMGNFSVAKNTEKSMSTDLEIASLSILTKYSLSEEMGLKKESDSFEEKRERTVGASPQKTEPERTIEPPVQRVAFTAETNAREAKVQAAPIQFIPGRVESRAQAMASLEATANAQSHGDALKAKEEAQKKEAEKLKTGETQKEIDKLGTFGDLGARHPGRRSRRKRKTRRRKVRGRRRRIVRGGRRRRRIRARRGGGRRRGRRGGRRRSSRHVHPRNNFAPRNERAPLPGDGQRNNPSERQDRQTHRRPMPPPPPVQGDMAIKGAPTSTPEQIQQFLEQTHSPAAREQGFAKNLYDICTKRGIDPSVALGFFMVESTMGRHGRGHNNKSLGNIRGRSPESQQTDGQFRRYSTWSEGARDWARLIDEAYVNKRGHQTLSQVVRVYCPGSEGSIRKYVSDVKGVVESFKRKNKKA